jgi:hypothetical protein
MGPLFLWSKYMATRFTSPITQYVNDDASDIGSGWKLNFYTTGTSTRKDTFSDSLLTTASANPVVADGAGRFADIFLESGTYKVVLTDDADVEKWTADPVDGAVGASGNVDTKTANYTVTVDDSTKIIYVDATSGNITISLLASATAGNGFPITVKKSDSSTNTVTVDGNGAETIDGSLTYVLRRQYEGVTLRADSSNWIIESTAFENTYTTVQSWAKGADIASATTVVLGTDGNSFDITGNTGPIGTITVAAGTWFAFQFDSTPTLTHGSTLVLPGATDFTAAAGDVLMFFAHAANQATCMGYALASGKAIVAPIVLPSPNFSTTSATVAADTQLDIAHSIGALPSLVQVYLKCTSADLSYAADDHVLINTDITLADRGVVVMIDTTNVTIVTGVQIDLINQNTFNTAAIDVTKWDWVVRAWT